MFRQLEDNPAFQLEHYDYTLPEELIAQEPNQKRESSKLLIFNKETKMLRDSFFSEIINELPKNALIIANNSRVVPARILGKRETGSKVEMLLLSPVALLEQSAKQKIISHIHTNKKNAAQNKINQAQTDQKKTDQQIAGQTDDGQHMANKKNMNQEQIEKSATAQVLLKGSKRIKIGEELSFHSLSVKILEKQDFGKHTVELTWKNSLVAELEKYGSLPLPPYIKRPDGPNASDLHRYQTVYAKDTQSGSVAAPTAGLHFTKEIQEKLLEQGFLWEEVTLHVGYGTFSPVRAEDIREHDMHAEYVEIPEKTAKAILKAKAENRPIITIGTTATRSLEGMAQAYHTFKEKGYCENFALNVPLQNENMHAHGENISEDKNSDIYPKNDTENNDAKKTDEQKTNRQKTTQQQNDHPKNDIDALAPDMILPAYGCSGYTNIFIYPGKEFNVIDGLLTNFHLPKSSLLMLVCAFAGYDNTMNAYAHAINEKYRFFSYGDAMLIRS